MSFTSTLAAAAILATSAVVSAQCDASDPTNNITYPLYGATFGASLHNWCVIDVTTASGATLKMMRVGDSITDGAVESTLGPVLLHHGGYTDGHSWLTQPNTDRAILPIELYNKGFDVYISNKRGTYTSPFTSGTDEDNYAFSHDEIAKDDLPSMINAILQTRHDEDSADCKKVNVVGNSLGGAEALIMASELPVASMDFVKQIVNTVPCVVPDLTGLLSAFATEDGDGDSDSDSSDWGSSSDWDSSSDSGSGSESEDDRRLLRKSKRAGRSLKKAAKKSDSALATKIAALKKKQSATS